MAITSIEELERIRDASEHGYQVWSDVASHALETIEALTQIYATRNSLFRYIDSQDTPTT